MDGEATGSGRGGIFAGEDPFALAQAWLTEAATREPEDPNAIALATADEGGMPNLRMVLLKEIELPRDGGAGGFVFYTNFEGAKGRELAANPQAALCLHWKSLRRQVRARGPVERVSDAQADAYYRSRSLQSRLGAWASAQSRPLASRGALMAKVARQGARHGADPARPPHWGGFRIRPVEMEFWADGAFRLHDRFRWEAAAPGCGPWQVTRLNP
jgi:pyridoxamine 5'-phosphate oxidase